MSLVSVSQIPTVSQLYQLKKLQPANKYPGDQKPEASRSMNDRIGLHRGDITKLEIDAIVNAANNSLLGGGGVDGSIHRAAGPGLKKECRALDGCDTGSAKITGAYELPCKKVIHAVGPVYSSTYREESEQDLRDCYTTSLELAAHNDCKSVAFSALSTGVYGYPSDAAAPVAIQAVKDFLESPDGDKLELVVFCTFVQKDVDAYDRWLPRFFPSIEPEDAEETTEQTKGEVNNIQDTKDGVTKGENEWEEIEGGGSADNGPVVESAETGKGDNTLHTKEAEAKSDEETLPDALGVETLDILAVEAADEGPSPKKQKNSGEK